ncbi:SAM-dependent methyltransferase [Colletotrichum incanum]|nr:SAM-dependent methyltransferase [Colletotrichum incanum]
MSNYPPTITNSPGADPISADPHIEDGSSDVTDTESFHTTSTASLKYWGPKDEKQNDALDFNRYWMTNFFNGELYLAPISTNMQRTLDLGTGTIMWATEFTSKQPSAEPDWVPLNCKFQFDDFKKEWTWPNEYSDLMHARTLEDCFSDLPNVRLVNDLRKPGGWFELKQFEVLSRSQTQELLDDYVFNRWFKRACEAQDKPGKPHSNATKRRWTEGLNTIGFVETVEKKWRIPIGTRPANPDLKRLVSCSFEFVDQSLEGFMRVLLKGVLAFAYQEAQLIIRVVRAELRNPKYTPYYYL